MKLSQHVSGSLGKHERKLDQFPVLDLLKVWKWPQWAAWPIAGTSHVPASQPCQAKGSAQATMCELELEETCGVSNNETVCCKPTQQLLQGTIAHEDGVKKREITCQRDVWPHKCTASPTLPFASIPDTLKWKQWPEKDPGRTKHQLQTAKLTCC